jgi:hypothetical protein
LRWSTNQDQRVAFTSSRFWSTAWPAFSTRDAVALEETGRAAHPEPQVPVG